MVRKKEIKKPQAVLVVEDERPLYEAIDIELRARGFVVYIAKTVSEALECLENNSIAVIWLDHYLQGTEDGIDLMRKIKASEFWKDIPVYVISNTAGEDKITCYMELGVRKCFVKSDHSLGELIGEVTSSIED